MIPANGSFVAGNASSCLSWPNLSYGNMATIVMNAVSAPFAAILNAVIVVTIWKTPCLHTPPNVLIGNLALSHLLTGLVTQPLLISHVIRGMCSDGAPSVALQRAYVLSSRIFADSTFFTLAYFSFERCAALLFHLRYACVVTTKRTVVMVLWTWVTVTAFVIGGQFVWNSAVANIEVTVGGITVCATALSQVLIVRIVRRHRRQIRCTQVTVTLDREKDRKDQDANPLYRNLNQSNRNSNQSHRDLNRTQEVINPSHHGIQHDSNQSNRNSNQSHRDLNRTQEVINPSEQDSDKSNQNLNQLNQNRNQSNQHPNQLNRHTYQYQNQSTSRSNQLVQNAELSMAYHVKVAIRLISVVGIYVLFYMPGLVAVAYHHFSGLAYCEHRTLCLIVASVSFTSAAIDPLFFCYICSDLREGVKQLLKI